MSRRTEFPTFTEKLKGESRVGGRMEPPSSHLLLEDVA